MGAGCGRHRPGRERQSISGRDDGHDLALVLPLLETIDSIGAPCSRRDGRPTAVLFIDQGVTSGIARFDDGKRAEVATSAARDWSVPGGLARAGERAVRGDRAGAGTGTATARRAPCRLG